MPAGQKSKPYAQYLEAGYQRSDYRNPILLSWEERIVEDERVVFEQVRRAVDWSKAFQIPRLAVRVDRKLMPIRGRTPLFRLESRLSRIPLECAYVWENAPVPPGTLFTIDARESFAGPAFVSDGGQLPDTHIRASHGGRMLYFDGQAPDAESPLGQWQSERKIADIAAFNAADAKAKPKPQASADGIVLQHFPPGRLAYRLFDLAAKEAVAQGHFEKGTTLVTPSEGRHFFLLVGDHE